MQILRDLKRDRAAICVSAELGDEDAKEILKLLIEFSKGASEAYSLTMLKCKYNAWRY
jgi:hypothetical protein